MNLALDHLVVSIDLDDTLFDWAPGARAYDNAQALLERTRPHPVAVANARRLHLEGATLVGNTGRSRDVAGMLDATRQQLAACGLDALLLELQPSWEGYARMTAHKAAAIRRHRARGHIGDHNADEAAAHTASVHFHHADVLRSPAFDARAYLDEIRRPYRPTCLCACLCAFTLHGLRAGPRLEGRRCVNCEEGTCRRPIEAPRSGWPTPAAGAETAPAHPEAIA